MRENILGGALMALPVGWAAAVTYIEGFHPAGIVGLSAALAGLGMLSLLAGGVLTFRR
ncbi:MAG: hypothetical protein JRM77_06970 [Nitrososphaerota archaeon]|nr:hypothetical protein [Nitrososphaerota archaeon]